MTYTEAFAEPTIGRIVELDKGREVLVSARLLKKGYSVQQNNPYRSHGLRDDHLWD